jgi:UDP-N-acetylglucosamine 2-epimerase
VAPAWEAGVSPLVHVVGARPNFVKAAPVVRAAGSRELPQRVVHTGQHYDEALSDVFFRQLGLPRPDVNLGVGSGSHGRQTAALIEALEKTFEDERPALVVVYGDVNSTMAAAIVAAKLCIPVAHVEAGLRSFDMTMPEEINRRVTDTLSDLLFVTSPEAIANLGREGVPWERIHLVGNPMIDTLLANLERFDAGAFRRQHGLGAGEAYALATFHRPANVDDPATAAAVLEALAGVAARVPVILPVHPRGRANLEAAGLDRIAGLRAVDPLGYLEFVAAMRGAALVVTDSGGVQEETTILSVPCLTVRPNTERPVTISHGTNRLVTVEGLLEAASAVLDGRVDFPGERPVLWDGRAGERIADILAAFLRAPEGRGSGGD